MKFRVWAGRPTLATEQGKELKNFEQFERWLESQPDGQIEFWAGRWWVIAKEAQPFTLTSGKAHCSHPRYKSKHGLDTKDYPGFFAYEAWREAERVFKFWGSIGSMTASLVDSGGDSKND